MRYWGKRALSYNKLQWVCQPDYIKKIHKSLALKKDDLVLDMGTGTGLIANTIKHQCKLVVGIDNSKEMLNLVETDGVIYLYMDARKMTFYNNSFDKIIARMVFHHILNDLPKAIREAYRVLKPYGLFVISEGIPPHPKLKKDYARIFKYKEKRRVFLERDLVEEMKQSGFKNIKTEKIILKRMSVNNWLNNDKSLTPEHKKMIINLHRHGSDFFKKEYELKESKGDIFINFTQLVVIGQK